MSSITCRQDLGIFASYLIPIQNAIKDMNGCTQIKKYTVLDRDADPKFPYQGSVKKIFWSVLIESGASEFSVFVAPRSDKNCLHFAREKRCFAKLSGVQRVLQPLEIENVGDFVYMIAELCSYGDLMEIFKSSPCPVSRQDLNRFFYEMVCIVHECHTQGVIIRDVKSDNFLVRKVGDTFEIILIDLGFGFIVGEGDPSLATEFLGSAEYLSIEDWTEHRKSGRTLPVTPARDLWAIGVTLYTNITDYFPVAKDYVRTHQGFVPCGMQLRPYDGSDLGLFQNEIKAILYNSRENRPTFPQLIASMGRTLERQYPGLLTAAKAEQCFAKAV